MIKGERFNTASHLVGAALAACALSLLVVWATGRRDPWRIVAFSVYGATLVVLYVASTLYHGFRGRAKEIFRRLDHGAIYLLIAGTYTPFTLVTLRSAWGWTLFGCVWGIAAAGIVLETVPFRHRRPVSIALYVLSGWLILVAARPLGQRLAPGGIAWLVAGGACYTLGLVAYGAKRLPRHHEIWHLAVLAGSVCHFVALAVWVA